MIEVKEVEPPKGLMKWLFKLPNFLYSIGAGTLLGSRFIQITHIGRKSGKVYNTVVEVVKHDPRAQKVWVVSGYKEKSDWLKNVLHHPQIEVNFRGRKSNANAVRLDGESASQILLNYAHQHPFAMRELAKFMGFQIDGSDRDIKELASQLPVIEIQFVL